MVQHMLKVDSVPRYLKAAAVVLTAPVLALLGQLASFVRKAALLTGVVRFFSLFNRLYHISQS